ncbi:uncharacterized protein VDAG_00086 [Verticillium dahliae VdLs.17]|uniref:Uncharacterized protein n=1 Tax=Verticillium dahliae (strain VdLs.17 / ATCC MYA-4575 / FGSC 10137) TaxID=498257 RepID=G2WRA3_VERDV|nr:uncharacterized protein VDAG_00086 [Verticillium dahliae VdLs.17]EGY13404.1 hypothetical protein VDAG_00086 [Verticillium dahliae VdLs.17]
MAGLRWKEAVKGATEVLFKEEPRTLADGDPWPTCEQLHPLHHDPGGIQHTKVRGGLDFLWSAHAGSLQRLHHPFPPLPLSEPLYPMRMQETGPLHPNNKKTF